MDHSDMLTIRKAALAALTLVALGGIALAQSPVPAPVTAAIAPSLVDPHALRLARAQRHMDRYDKDKGGFLSRSEYQRWYQSTARRRSALTWKKHAAGLFKRLDANRDGRLTIDEFVADPHFRRPRIGRGASAQAQ